MARPEERLPDSLQEAVLAVLAVDEKYGPIVAGQVGPEHFDGQLHDAAAAILAYWRQYRAPPGEAHLVAVIAGAKDATSASTARRLAGRLVAQAVTVNAKYIASRAGEFVRRQDLLGAVTEATERFLAGGEEGLVPEVETILRRALDTQRSVLEAGTFLSDAVAGMRFMDRSQEGYALGIPVLDQAGIALFLRELLLYVGPKNSGKSTFCVHCGRQGLTQGARVVHVTLEMGADAVVGRYYQALFGASKKDEKYLRAELEFDDLDRLTGFSQKQMRPRMAWSNPGAKKWLRERIAQWGTRLGRLVVHEFPSGTLTMTALRGYLDYLEAAHSFVPHILIVDYPDLMSLDRRNYRLDLGRLYVELRGLGQERNLAVVAPTQGNRESLGASRVSSSMISEDVSKVFTADTVLTYSQTTAEARIGLARLHVDYARESARGQTVLLAQSYQTGQYVLQSAPMRQVYWDRLGEVAGEEDAEEADDTRRRRR